MISLNQRDVTYKGAHGKLKAVDGGTGYFAMFKSDDGVFKMTFAHGSTSPLLALNEALAIRGMEVRHET